MELEEAEDEEWDASAKYSSEPNTKNCCKVRGWVWNRGLCLGRKILVAGFLVSASTVVVPPLVVASAVGLAVSMPSAVYLVSHACTQNLVSKFLPMPTPQGPRLRKNMCFQPDVDKEEQALADETNRDIETVDDGENVASGCDCGPQEEDVIHGMEGHSRGETSGVKVQLMSGDNGVGTMVEGIDKIGNEIEEFESPFEVTTVVLEESEDQAMEGDIEEAELQRETKGLLEKIRDEGRTDMTRERGECVEGICGGANESDKKIGPVVEDMEVAWEDTHSGTIGGTEEDLRICEEMLHSRNDESKDTTCNEVESSEPVRGLLEGNEFDDTNDSQKPMVEPPELMIPGESIEDLPIEAMVYNISLDEDSSEVISEKIGIHLAVKEEPNPPPDCPTILPKEKLDNESSLDLFDGKRIDPDEYAYTIDLREESSNVGRHTDSMEVLVSSVEQESMLSEGSSGESTISSQEVFEVVFHEEKIWKEIDVIRKIVGYEGTKQASCAEELKALYIFTGVEPPTCLNENTSDPAEIKEKLHFLMSILGIKSNMA
ncbi:hypothetical protein CR513_35536, partial [Mucuna pruriens]